jgi:hypothetical protein
MFCLTMNFNCSNIDTNCIRCKSVSLCTQCNSAFAAVWYANLSSSCQLCSTLILGCVSCSDSATCTNCLSPSYVLENNVCYICNHSYNNCLECSPTVCTKCQSSFYLDTSGVCQSCPPFSTSCVGCSTIPNCS